MHQHGPCATPVSRSISIAHAFVAPQSGQRVGSTGDDWGMARLSCAPALPAQRMSSSPRKAKCEGIGLDSGSTYTTAWRVPSIGFTCVS